MGFFSKKNMTCVCCGKTFQTRFGIDTCDACISKQVDADMAAEKFRKEVEGYVKYAKVMKMPKYSESQLKEIASHRDRIVDTYKENACITKAELKEKSKRFLKHNKAETTELMAKIARSTVGVSYGTGFTTKFFVPTAFERTIVDAGDVYAVTYIGVPSSENKGYERLICAVFTNDPYIPVFPYACEAKVGFFEVLHSKEGRKETETFFENMCPNLKYPVQPMKEFKKFIKNSNEPNKAFILEMLSNLDASWGIFAKKHITPNFSDSTIRWIEDAGYIFAEDVAKIMELDNSFRSAIWESYLK